MDSEFSNAPLDISQLPTIDSVEYKKLSPHFPKLVLIQTTLMGLFPVAIILTMVIFLTQISPESDQQPLGDLPIPLLGVIYTGFMILLLLLSYFEAKTKRFCLREHDLIFHYGLLARKTVVQPLLRVQHLEVSQNPLELRFGLASLKLFSAGGMRYTFAIPGLTKKQAEQLRQYVVNYQENHHE